MLPQQLQLSEPISVLGFEALGFERFCMESPIPMCGSTSSNAAEPTLCDATFIAEFMESAMPACTMSSNAGDAMLCDVTFITELMECDFAQTDHNQHHNDAIDADRSTCIHVQNASNLNEENHAYDASVDVDPDEGVTLSTLAQIASNPHPYSHQHTEQFHGSLDNDNVNLNLDSAVSANVQNASNLDMDAHHYRDQLLAGSLVSDFDGPNLDDINIGVEGDTVTHMQDACSLHVHAQQHGQLSHGFQNATDHDDLYLTVSRNQSTHTLHSCVDQSTHALHARQTDEIKEFQAHNIPHCSTGLTPCSSDGNESEEYSILRFPHHSDITKEALLAAVTQERSFDPCSSAEKLKDHEDSSEKAHMTNLNILHLLLACAEAVSEDNLEVASVVLTRLQELSCKYGSPLQRLSFCLCNALEAKILPSAQEEFRQSLKMPLPPCDMLETFCVFYNVNPIGRFCHLTLNQLILDNTVSDTHVHIVDLHIGYGMQWAAFLQAIALRPNGPPKLRLTAVGAREEHMVSTGNKLMDLARTLQVPFEYCPIASHLQSLDLGMIDIRQDEVCVISSLGQFHTLLHKGSEFVDAFLAGLRSLEPKVLVFAENDVNHNNPLFLNRFVECLKYYAAVFESLDAALPPTSQARLKIERLLCGRKIGSIVACEGAERVERHETMDDWMQRLERAGFRNASLTHTAVNQAKLLLNLYYPNGYSLTEEHEALTLRWNGAALMGIGIWH